MCVDKGTVKDIVDGKIDLLTSELQTYHIEVKKDLEFIKKQTSETNGRVTSAETEIQSLKDNHLERELKCPFRDRILSIEKEMSGRKTVAEMLKKQENDRREDRKTFFKKLQAIGAVVSAIIVVLMFGADILEWIGEVLTD